MVLLFADDSELRMLDSSVKRNTALVKRLRQLSEDNTASVLEDISRTNQSKVATDAAVQSSKS